MSDIRNELDSIKAFVVDCFPTGATVAVENKPADLRPKYAVIELVGNRTATVETAFHNLIDSTVQITYYGSNKLECIQAMQTVLDKLSNKRVIPLKNTDRFIKYHAPSVTGAYSTQTTGVYVIACMLRIYLREAVPQPTYELINEVNADINGDT